MNYYNYDLLPVLIALAFMSGVLMWVAIKNHKNWVIMFFVIPLTFLSAWTVYVTIDNLLGYPVNEKMGEQNLYLHHVSGPDGKYIFVWIVEPGDKQPKAITVPDTKNNREELDKAKKKQEAGNPQMVGGNVLDGKGQTSGGELRTYDFQDTGPDIHKDNTQNAPVPQQNQLPGPVIERTKPTVSPQRRLEFNQQVEQHDLIWGQTEFTTPGP